MTRRILANLVVLTASIVGPSAAQSIDSLFAQAQRSYRDGAFTDAIAVYELILSEGHSSAAVYYNLGNAYFRAGNMSRSLLAYERALRMDPTDSDIQHNARLTRLRTVDRIDPLPELFIVTWVRWLNATVPVRLTAGLFLAAWVIVFSSLSVLYLVRSNSLVPLMRLSFFSGSIISFLFGLLLALQIFGIPETTEGIIMSPTVTAKTSPDGESMDAFVIHEGLKVGIGDTVEGWVRITLADGKTGWIRGAEVETI